MREIRQSGSEGGARFNPSFLPLSLFRPQKLTATEMLFCFAGNHGPFVWSPALRYLSLAARQTPPMFRCCLRQDRSQGQSVWSGCLQLGWILRHGVGRTTVFWSARGRAQRRRRFGRARRGKPTHSQSASQSAPLQAVRKLGILNEDISAP
jgi:hypothetical protein